MQLLVRLEPQYAAGILAGLVQANLWQIQAAGKAGQTPVLDGLLAGAAARKLGIKPDSPHWPEGAIYYKKLDPTEHWKDWKAILADGFADCEDLASAVAAELMAAGRQARPVAYEAIPSVWHVVVQYKTRGGKWRYADPSLLGGMKGAA